MFQQGEPAPAIAVSRETTYITEPLRPDGLPDYERYVLELYRGDAAPENNAAVPLLQALFPSGLDPAHARAVVAEVGMEEAPSASEVVEPVDSKANQATLWRWLVPRWPNQRNFSEVDAWAERMTGQAVWRPWTSEQMPPLSNWLATNQKPLDLIVEASRRPRYFAPSPTLTNNRRDLLVNMIFPQQKNMLILLARSIHEGCRALLARAMWHLGEGLPMDAWQDLHAIHHLSRLLSHGLTFIERSKARELSAMACYATATLLDHRKLTVDQARQIHRDLILLRPLSGVAHSLEHHERLFALDAVVYAGSSGDLEELGHLDEQLGMIVELMGAKISIDWHLVLRETNRGYDRLIAAARLKAREARITAINEIERDIAARLASQVRDGKDIGAETFGRHERSELLANLMLSSFISSFERAIALEEQANTQLELTRVAGALAIHRAERVRYPEKLDHLVPTVLKELPRDLLHRKPYVYRPDGDGYLLYSTGENGDDDGGLSGQTRLFEGPPFDERGRTGRNPDALLPAVPMGADDIAIRVPHPSLEIPNLLSH